MYLDIAKALLKLCYLNELMLFAFVKCLYIFLVRCLFSQLDLQLEFTLFSYLCVPVLNIKFLEY